VFKGKVDNFLIIGIDREGMDAMTNGDITMVDITKSYSNGIEKLGIFFAEDDKAIYEFLARKGFKFPN